MSFSDCHSAFTNLLTLLMEHLLQFEILAWARVVRILWINITYFVTYFDPATTVLPTIHSF